VVAVHTATVEKQTAEEKKWSVKEVGESEGKVKRIWKIFCGRPG